MTKLSLIAGLTLAAFAFPALADAVEDGANDFKKCKACHSIIDNDGNAIVKGGKTGPNLYGVIGRQVGSAPDFKYSEFLIAVGADGTVWDEAMILSLIHIYHRDISVGSKANGRQRGGQNEKFLHS